MILFGDAKKVTVLCLLLMLWMAPPPARECHEFCVAAKDANGT